LQEICIVARILIIDDEEQPRHMLRLALERAGYEVVEARDGNEGLQRFHETPTDLIITDLLMPEKEGLETIIDVRREFPNVKIIAMSGGGRSGSLNFLEIAKRLGAQRTLAKPFGLQEMLAAVRELLQPSGDGA
jgi:DNA-binding response OmpR family regulator